jgi:glycosyltransferase involved in cell wall biosynthesis
VARPKKKVELLSVIVPAYKQEKTIKEDLLRLQSALKHLHIKYEIIVVIDGKVDKTERIVKSLKSRKIISIGYKTNRGKGHAVRFGMVKSKGNIVAFIDAGMDLNPNALSMLFEHFKWYNADVIVGSKLHPVSKIKYPWQRKILSWGYRILVKILFGLSIRDTQVGVKIYKRKVLDKVLPRLLVKTYAFDIEILAVAHYLGYKRIYEAPVELNFNERSSISTKGFWKVISLMLWDTLAVFYRLRILRYYSDQNKRLWKYDKELNYNVNLP